MKGTNFSNLYLFLCLNLGYKFRKMEHREMKGKTRIWMIFGSVKVLHRTESIFIKHSDYITFCISKITANSTKL